MPLDVSKITDPDKLRTLMANAKRLGNEEIRAAAFKRLCQILPAGSDDPEMLDDPLKVKAWRAIHAAEEIKTQLNGKTTRLSRTRQKIARDGVVATMEAMALKPRPSEGFHILVEGGHPELVFEHIILEHPDRFSTAAVQAARERLRHNGIALPS